MRVILPIILLILTVVLVAAGTLLPGQVGSTVGIAAGTALPGVIPEASTPEQAITFLLSDVQRRNWEHARSQLANSDKIDGTSFTMDLAGGYGSLRTFSNLVGWDLHPLHATSNDAQVRTRFHWSTPVGPQEDLRDLNVVRQGSVWKVVWPIPHFPNIPAQVVPVNYLRWDLVSPIATAGDSWGEQNLDSPRVRIVSMNAVDYEDGSVIMGEVVNEDTVPAFVNVNATLVDGSGKPIAEESSFDKILHVLLPKQVSPYRIDFSNVSLDKVKNVRMDVKASLIPASADPVIAVSGQSVDTDPQGRKTLRGQLLNESGRAVNIPHVIATFYDNNGRVVWVADGYVDRTLFPQTPEAFSLEIPKAMAGKVQTYHVVVNEYTLANS